MTWFEYNYTDSYEIFNSVKLISKYSIMDFGILIAWILFIIFATLYIFPAVDSYVDYLVKSNLKSRNMKMIRKIALQKDIENEIAQELKLNI
jgi:hypothetical protein